MRRRNVLVVDRAGQEVGSAFAGLPVTVLCFAFGVLFMTPFAVLESEAVDRAAPLQRHAGPILYLSVRRRHWSRLIGCTSKASNMSKRPGAQHYPKTVAAALLAAAVLGEALTWNLLVSMGLIGTALYGVFLAIRN